MGADDDVIYNLNVELGELTEELTGNREQYDVELGAVRQRYSAGSIVPSIPIPD